MSEKTHPRVCRDALAAGEHLETADLVIQPNDLRGGFGTISIVKYGQFPEGNVWRSNADDVADDIDNFCLTNQLFDHSVTLLIKDASSFLMNASYSVE